MQDKLEIHSAVRKREDLLLKRERSYRSARLGSIFLMIFIFVGIVVSAIGDEPKMYTPWLWGICWFFAALGSYAQARIDYVRTIRYYRDLIEGRLI